MHRHAMVFNTLTSLHRFRLFLGPLAVRVGCEWFTMLALAVLSVAFVLLVFNVQCDVLVVRHRYGERRKCVADILGDEWKV